MTYDYIINAGKSQDDCEPIKASPDKAKAIEAAKLLLAEHRYNYTEVVFMPESNIDINEVVWTSKGV